MAAPTVVLYIARTAAVDTNPLFVAWGTVIGLGLASAALSAVRPAHWLYLALIVAAPITLLGLAMYWALQGGYGVWLLVGPGSLAASVGCAMMAARWNGKRESSSSPATPRGPT